MPFRRKYIPISANRLKKLKNEATIIFENSMTAKSPSKPRPPSCVKGRKGKISVADCLIQVLWSEKKNHDKWPAKSLEQLQTEASLIAGYLISSSTIRSTIYGHSELFVRAGKEKRVLWKLAEGSL
jgi:hypothetical protein